MTRRIRMPFMGDWKSRIRRWVGDSVSLQRHRIYDVNKTYER